MSDEDKDLDIRQEEQERLRKSRAAANKARKENPEKHKEYRRLYYLKKKAEGRIKKVSKEKRAENQRRHRLAVKSRTEGLIEDLNIEIYELKSQIEAYHYAFARKLSKTELEAYVSNARDHINANKGK